MAEFGTFIYEYLRKNDPAGAARFVCEWNFNPDEPRDWRGRWTTGGSDDEDGGPDARSPGNPRNSPGDPEPLPQDPFSDPISSPGFPGPCRGNVFHTRFGPPSAELRPGFLRTARQFGQVSCRPAQGRLRHTVLRHEPFMIDKDFNYIVRVAQNDNPPDPDTPAAKLFPTMTIAVLVEIDVKGGLAGIGHTGIAIGEEGVGFAPEKMKFYDFGPKGNKSHSGRLKVDGSPWWYKKVQGYNPANEQGTGKRGA